MPTRDNNRNLIGFHCFDRDKQAKRLTSLLVGAEVARTYGPLFPARLLRLRALIATAHVRVQI